MVSSNVHPRAEGTCLYDPLSLSTMAARSRPAPLTKMLNGLLDGISDGKDEVRDIACLGETYQGTTYFHRRQADLDPSAEGRGDGNAD